MRINKCKKCSDAENRVVVVAITNVKQKAMELNAGKQFSYCQAKQYNEEDQC